MELTIKGTQEEITKLLQTIVSSQEQLTTNPSPIFSGLSFDKNPVPFTEYVKNYEDYVRRCSI